MEQSELPGQSVNETPCYDHPDAPHGFMRDASHSAGHYVCECKGWFEVNVDDVILSLENIKERMTILGFEKTDIDDQIKFLKGLSI